VKLRRKEAGQATERIYFGGGGLRGFWGVSPPLVRDFLFDFQKSRMKESADYVDEEGDHQQCQV
jgi:hypothetical protein